MEILNNIGLINIAQKCYAESHRFYHNWSHITDMIRIAKKHDIDLDITTQVALLFHDIIYVPRNPHNEISSAYMMVHYIKPYREKLGPNFDVMKAFDLIADTKHADPEMFTHKEESMIIHDLDYFYFAQPYNLLRVIRNNIRSEHSAINDELFNKGSIQFLETLKSKGNIFFTKKFQQYNTVAIENIDKEIAYLESKLKSTESAIA